MSVPNKALFWCILGAALGGSVGIGAALGTFIGGSNSVAEVLGWVLVLLSGNVGEVKEWKIVVAGIAYYGVLGGFSGFLAAEKKWKWLIVWIVLFLSMHLTLSHFAAQQVFQGLEKLKE
jgi:hypothetical protein